MFKLTRQEQFIVAFLAAALLLGTAVRQWRARHLAATPAPTAHMGER